MWFAINKLKMFHIFLTINYISSMKITCNDHQSISKEDLAEQYYSMGNNSEKLEDIVWNYKNNKPLLVEGNMLLRHYQIQKE